MQAVCTKYYEVRTNSHIIIDQSKIMNNDFSYLPETQRTVPSEGLLHTSQKPPQLIPEVHIYIFRVYLALFLRDNYIVKTGE